MRTHSLIVLSVISALIIFPPIQEGGTTHSSQMIIRLLIVMWLGIVLAEGIRGGSLAIPVVPIGSSLLLFVGVAFAGTLFSPYPHPGWQWLLVIVGYVAFFYLLVSFVDRWDHIRTLIVIVVVTGLGEAGWAILQGLAWNVLRPSGTFFNPNFLAGYITATWAILLGCALYGKGREAKPAMPSVLWWSGLAAALLGIFLAILLTQSRGGMAILFVSTVFIFSIRYGWKVAGSCAAFLILLGLLIPTPARDRVILEHYQNPVAYARWQMWQGAIRQMIDHPLGIGLGLYQYTYPRYAFPVEGEIARYGKVAQTPHNDYLQMGVEMGLGAIFIFMMGIFVVMRELKALLQRRLRRWQRGVIVGLGGAGVALLVHATIDSSLRESAIAILLLLCGGLIVSAGRLAKNGAAPIRVVPIGSRLAWGFGCAAVLLLTCVEVIRCGLAWTTFESASRHAMAGNTVAAIEELKDAIALDPEKALYHHGLGSVYAKVFERTGANDAFLNAHAQYKEAIGLNPLDNRLLGLLGQLYASAAQVPQSFGITVEERRGWLRAAVPVYEHAIQLAPFSAIYRYEQARIYWLLGERGKAEQRAKEAEGLEPNFLPARALLARLCIDGGHIDGARVQLREIQERQARYKPWPKNSLDHAFLNVDVSPILSAVGKMELVG